jgi:hypothetical protein
LLYCNDYVIRFSVGFFARGVYILENTTSPPPPPWGVISADIIWGKNMTRGREKGGKCKGKQKKRERKRKKEGKKETMGSKRVK